MAAGEAIHRLPSPLHLWYAVVNTTDKTRRKPSMPSVPRSSGPKSEEDFVGSQKSRSTFWMLHLPTNVYLLLFFTLGKGMQLTIATLNVNYYAYSLGYHPDFIGLLSAMPALGALVSSV